MERKCFFILSAFLCLFCIKAVSQTTLIERKSSYPKNNDDYYFKPLPDMVISNKKLYAVENFGHKLLIFDINGDIRLDKKISQHGQGPGDLNLPIAISVDQNEIAVKDNYGFSFFDMEGKYISKFLGYTSKLNFVLLNSKLYWVNFSPDENHLIGVYSTQGERLSTFGNKYLKLNFSLFKELSPYFIEDHVYSGNLLSDGEYLFFINSFFGQLNVFNHAGKSISEANIVNLFGNLGADVLTINDKLWLHNKFAINSNGSFRTYSLFIDAYLSGDLIYLLKNYRSPKAESDDKFVSILAIDKSTHNLMKEYSFHRNADDVILCFAVTEKEYLPTFYIFLRTSEGDIIAEYSE